MKYILFLFVFFIFSCQSSNHQNETKAIRKVIAAQAEAWNSGNLKGYMAGYFLSDSLRFASGGNISYGWQTTLERYQKGYPDKATMGKLIFSDIDIEMISSEAALVFGKWELERENDHPRGLFTLIFKKTGDSWRVVHDHTSSAKQ